MIGVSLPFEWLLGKEEPLGNNIDSILQALKARGVDSIELRTVFLRHAPSDVLRVAELLWSYGFNITVHVKAHSAELAVSEVFDPLAEVLANLQQERLTLVLHPIVGDNVSMLNALADYRDSHGYPVTIALENNRLLPDKSEGDSAALVYDAVCQADRENVGICFDTGHYAYYLRKNHPSLPFTLPAADFWKRVLHTHIHALDGLKTHFPLGSFELPLPEILGALSYKYFGVYNIELDFPRWKDQIDPQTALLDSVSYLAQNLPPCAKLYMQLRKEFDVKFQNACKIFEKTSGTHFALLHSTFYLFNTNGFAWALDPAFRAIRNLAKAPQKAATYLRPLSLIAVTHAHEDHFEKETVALLAENDTKWLIPDFMEEKALAYGIKPQNMIVAHEGDTVTIGPLTILVFRSNHFRPVTNKGVPEYGYRISAPNAPSLLFPADVRNFSIEEFPALPGADYAFCNVWLGDRNDSPETRAGRIEPFARFALRLSQKTIFLTHLYESARRDSDMWREEHAQCIQRTISTLSPDTSVQIPSIGDILELNA